MIAPIAVKFSLTSYEKQKHLVPGKSFVPTGETDSRAHPQREAQKQASCYTQDSCPINWIKSNFVTYYNISDYDLI